MPYDVVAQNDHDVGDHDSTSCSPPPNLHLHLHLHGDAPAEFTPLPVLSARGLFLGSDNTGSENYPPTRGLSLKSLVRSITSKSTETKSGYDMVEGDDFANDAPDSPKLSNSTSIPAQHHSASLSPSPPGSSSPSETPVPLQIPRPRRRRSPATAAKSSVSSPSIPSRSRTIVRTASSRSVPLRHPTPDLHVLQGAYMGNIERLEKTAESLSMTSSINDAIKDLHDELKRSDSRKSSLLSQNKNVISRQVSNASSIVEVNSAARSGGYSPAGFMMSPKSSFSGPTSQGRSASRSSRFGSRPEPELEGRPLDSFVGMHSSIPPTSPIHTRTESIAENDEGSSTLTRPVVEFLETAPIDLELRVMNEDARPTMATSNAEETEDNVEKMFAGFDGIHVSLEQQRRVDEEQEGEEQNTERTQRRASTATANRLSTLSMARPQSYADPTTGQQMVYYPAPVPMMLNLPQKLSKNPSSIARNKRRSQVLSNIPAAARQSAIWLPDVLETEDEPDLPVDDSAQQQEYVPQHQRAIMGGRRLTQDLSGLPAQLRASVYFDLPTPTQVVELKEQSAVATLDSILDASANAPVSAFTDHAFAGHLGAEVYGKSRVRNSKGSTTLLEAPNKKRHSSLNILLHPSRGHRLSSDLLHWEEKKSATTVEATEPSKDRVPLDDDEEEDEAAVGVTSPLHRSVAGDLDKSAGDEDEESDEGQRDDEIYTGPPTTLLAELQLRKQQQKQRTKPLTKSFPNGMHSTLLEMDAVAQVEQKSRKHKRVALAWEDPAALDQDEDSAEDDDIPLAMLFANKTPQIRDITRPMGLMERREMEDNEPLSQRRNRLQGHPNMPRASTMMNLSSAPFVPEGEEEEEEETLAQRVRRLKEEQGTQNGLPAARPVSGDFALEMISQFGGDLLDSKDVKGKEKEVSSPPPPEEDETLGQRRKRLQAEREARAKEVGGKPAGPTGATPPRPLLNQKRSMANILSAHPSAGADRVVSYEKPVGGLLALHQQKSATRALTMPNFDISNVPVGQQRISSGAFKGGLYNDAQGGQQHISSGAFKGRLYNDAQGGIVPPPQQKNLNMFSPQHAQFPQPSLGNFNTFKPNVFDNQMMMPFTNPYAMAIGGYNPNMQIPMPMGFMPNMNMNMGLQMGQPIQPLNQGQIDMVERWRQSVMQ